MGLQRVGQDWEHTHGALDISVLPLVVASSCVPLKDLMACKLLSQFLKFSLCLLIRNFIYNYIYIEKDLSIFRISSIFFFCDFYFFNYFKFSFHEFWKIIAWCNNHHGQDTDSSFTPKIPPCCNFIVKPTPQTSLLVQWAFWVSFVSPAKARDTGVLVWEDSMCRGATKLVWHNWSLHTLEPVLFSKRIHRSEQPTRCN